MVLLPWAVEPKWWSGSNTFINSVDYRHVVHEEHPRTAQQPSPAPPDDFHRQLTISIYRHAVPHLQVWGHWICTIKTVGTGEHIICILQAVTRMSQ